MPVKKLLIREWEQIFLFQNNVWTFEIEKI